MIEFEGIAPAIAEALAKRGYNELTPVQKAMRDPELADRDALVSAQTGSGKTVAFGLALAPTLLGDERRFGPAGAPLALDDINLDIAPGSHVAIVGSSGSGKTTLANLLLRLYDPTGGRIVFDGHELRDLTLRSVRTQTSVILQDSLLFATSIRENIAYGNPDASADQIEAAARLANAHEFIVNLPEGYETVVGEQQKIGETRHGRSPA